MYTLNVDLIKSCDVTILGGWERGKGEQMRAKLSYTKIKINRQYKNQSNQEM